MKKIILFILISFFVITPLYAQETEDNKHLNEFVVDEYQPAQNYYYRAEIVEVVSNETETDEFVPALERYYQEVRIKFLEGPYSGQTEPVRFISGTPEEAGRSLKVGETVVVITSDHLGETSFAIADRYRIDSLAWLGIIFIVLVIIFAGWKGARSILGLGFTMLVIFYYILPRILAGEDPFFIFLIGGLAIALFSIYLGHGFSKRTSIAVVSTVITLFLSIALATLAIEFSHLFGLGSEEAFYIQVGEVGVVNLRGLLLGGMIIGVLGVLDDITTAQAAVVQEIYRANNGLKFLDLAKRGLRVGHEHIVSLVNTLVLAYVGASFPLLILFSQKYVPLWVTLNSERVVEEIVRTLVGSSSLVVAVPITTYLAAYYFSRFGIGDSAETEIHKH